MPRKVNPGKNTHAKDEPVAEAEEDVPLAQLAYHIMHDGQKDSPQASRSTSPVHSDTEPNEPTATTSTTHAKDSSNNVDELSLVTARAVAHIFGWQLKRAAPLPRRRSNALQDRQTMRFALRHRQSHKTLTVEIKPRSRQDTHMSLVTINGEPMWPKQAALRLMKETKIGFATGTGADSQANTSISVASAASIAVSGEESIHNTPLHPVATTAAPLLVSASSAAGSEPSLVRQKASKRPRSPSPTPMKEEEGNKGRDTQEGGGVGGIVVVAEEQYSEVKLRSETSVSASAPLVAEEHITCNTSEAFIMEVTPAATAASSPLPQLPPPRKAKTASKSTTTVVPPSNARMAGKSASPSHAKGSSNTRHTTTPPPLPSHHKHHSHHKQYSSPSSSPTSSSSLYRYVGHGLQPLAQATLCDGYSSTTMVDILAHSRALLRSCGYALAQANGSKKSSEQGETSEAALLDAILHEDYNTVDVFAYCEQGENVRERMRQGLYTAVAAGRLSGDALHAGVQALQQCEDEERRYFLPNTRSVAMQCDASSELDHTTSSNCLPLNFPRTVPPTFLPVSGAALLEVQYRLNALTRPTHLLPSAPIAAADNNPMDSTSLTCCTPPSSAKERQPRYEIHVEGIVPAPRIAITHTYHLRGTRRVQLPCPPNSTHWHTRNTTTASNDETAKEGSDTHLVLPAMGMNPEADLMLYVHTRFMTPSVRAMLLASANATPATTSTIGDGSNAVVKPETTVDNNNITGNTPATRDIDKLLRRAENIQPIPMPDLEWYYGTL